MRFKRDICSDEARGKGQTKVSMGQWAVSKLEYSLNFLKKPGKFSGAGGARGNFPLSF